MFVEPSLTLLGHSPPGLSHLLRLAEAHLVTLRLRPHQPTRVLTGLNTDHDWKETYSSGSKPCQ